MTVGPAVVASIAVTPAGPSVAKGLTQQFTATATLSDNTTLDVSPQVAWASSRHHRHDQRVPGWRAALAVGNTTIRATLNGVSGSTVLTVNPAALVSIAVGPANPTIATGTARRSSPRAH